MHAASCRSLVLAALIVASAVGLSAGGWSVITLADFPDYAMAGKPLTLTFSVRQHGNNLVSGLKPSIHASVAGGPPWWCTRSQRPIQANTRRRCVLDAIGDWSIMIDGGFNPEDKGRGYNSIALPPLRVIRAGSAPLVLFSDAERGASLMVTKGCVSCHAPGSDRDITRKRLAPSYVKMLLADPSVRQIEMPDLDLRPAEISALASYLVPRHR